MLDMIFIIYNIKRLMKLYIIMYLAYLNEFVIIIKQKNVNFKFFYNIII